MYSQAPITGQTCLKTSSFSYAFFLLRHSVRKLQLQGLWSRVHHTCQGESSSRTELASPTGQVQAYLSFSPAIPCVSTSNTGVHQPATLFTGTLTAPLVVCVTWDNSTSPTASGLFCPRNSIWKWYISTMKKCRFLGRFLSLLQKGQIWSSEGDADYSHYSHHCYSLSSELTVVGSDTALFPLSNWSYEISMTSWTSS